MAEKVAIFDSTLRDGEQTPGARLNMDEKIKIAHQLARLNVDVIEAGFPVSSPGELNAVKKISGLVRGPVICGLARCVKEDIDAAWEALKDAERPRIHVFLAASDIHIEHKLKKDPEQLIEQAVEAVRYAKKFTADVEYSPEDATRAREEYLYRVIEAVIKAGATVINIPDTVGYAVPHEFGPLIGRIRENAKGADKVTISVHCHNDLGLAVINSLEAVKYGARQIECNINGIGERAGNAAMEEIAVGLHIRKDAYPYDTRIKLQELYRSSRLVSKLTGIGIPVNKAVIGKNAFAHSSGIHQDGILKNKITYEIIDAELVGGKAAEIVLTARSGRHALQNELKEMGYTVLKPEDLKPEDLKNENLKNEDGRIKNNKKNEKSSDMPPAGSYIITPDYFAALYDRFLQLADKKREVYREDIEALVFDHVSFTKPVYELDYLQTVSGSNCIPAAVIRLVQGENRYEEVGVGSGPIDAAYNAINKITGISIRLKDYRINAITEGRDALGEVILKSPMRKKESPDGE